MRVIAKSHLVGFWESRKHDAEMAERDLSVWYKLAKAGDWDNFAALKQTFGTTDQVGTCVVFDVGNNHFRLIGRVNYKRGIIHVLRVMDHPEYDKKRWINDCGCHKPPPKKTVAAKATPAKPAKPKPTPRRGKRAK